MRTFIFTLGTRGDVQPYLALACGLRDAGHEVTLCTSNRFAPLVREYAVHFSEFNDAFTDLLDSKEAKGAMEGSANPIAVLMNMRKLMKKSSGAQRSMMSDGWKAAQDFRPDVIVFHPKAYGGAHFAEKLNVPSVMALAVPGLVPTKEFSALGFPRLPLGRGYNRATHGVILTLTRRMFGKYINEWRSHAGLVRSSRGRDIFHDQSGQPIPVVHAYSRHVAPIPSDWPRTSVVTGFWFLERHPGWEPPASLLKFLEGGEPPVYVGFGSMSGEKAKSRSEVVLGSIARAKVRAVVAGGWGGLSESASSSTVHFVRDVPHDWLFPRMAAVVHHGGAGTTAAGLRAGRPTVICPFIADQPFWGRCLFERGLGPQPIPQRKLTVENLASAIEEAMTDREMIERCRAVSAKISSENGIARAVGVIEAVVKERR